MNNEAEKNLCEFVIPALRNAIYLAASRMSGDDPFSREAAQQELLDTLVKYLTMDSPHVTSIRISELNRETAAHWCQVRSVKRYRAIFQVAT